MSKTISRETLQQLWKKSKSYTDEKLADIPDRTGYWNGRSLTLDNLENGIYTVKFVSETGIVESEKQVALGANRTFALSLPDATAYMEIFTAGGEKVGRIRTDVPAVTGGGGAQGADGKSAYEIWLSQGNTGTESDFLASLKGEKGADGYSPVRGVDYATEEDIMTIAQAVLEALPTAEGVNF